MEVNKYYSVLYEATYPDTGVVSYKPIKVIKGNYDSEKGIFEDEETKKSYRLVNMCIPSFGKDSTHILDALEGEIETFEQEKEFFAFPIEESRLLDYCDHEIFASELPVESYEREARGYYLYSIYDETIGDNIFYIADKLEDHDIYNLDISLDLVESVATAQVLTGGQKQLVVLVAGENQKPEDFIAEEIKENKKETTEKAESIIFDFDPDLLEEQISSEVIAQDHVVKSLVSMMYKNKRYHEHGGLKSNMLILGPSGCGKTEIVRSLSRHLNIPMTIFDATSASASGYVGNSVTQAIKDLVMICNGDVKKAEHGIIVIDEIDKLASTGGEEITKGDVQDELFKMLEGDEITISSENSREKAFRFNPKNVTFIGIGSAQALIESKQKEDNKKTIGFCNDDVKRKETSPKEIELSPEDLIKFGLKPELLRRLNIIKVVKNLSKEDLVTILTESKISNLKLYEKAFQEVDHVSLKYETSVLENIALKASKEKAGASGLKRIVDDMLETSIRKIRLLGGKAGELVLTNATIEDPDDFELYKTSENDRELVYSKVKVKK